MADINAPLGHKIRYIPAAQIEAMIESGPKPAYGVQRPE
jgi:hypothetical protein